MDYLSIIKKPINAELSEFISLFNDTLSHSDGLLSTVLEHIRSRGGKRMRPILVLLIAKAFGKVTQVAQHAAVGLELLHTASLVHDDVVDDSVLRRGQASVNATYNNKVAVLVGDFILSTALLSVANTASDDIVKELATLGRTLSNGEILQLSNIYNKTISEEVYYSVIRQKTAALFETCAVVGAKAVNASRDQIEAARLFGQNIGIIFQIKDDIFDYFDDTQLGKPTGNDMAEGKLTLPVIYALNAANNPRMQEIAHKVKEQNAKPEEIVELVNFTKQNGGIEYAERRMLDFKNDAIGFVEKYIENKEIRFALNAYLDFVIDRKS